MLTLSIFPASFVSPKTDKDLEQRRTNVELAALITSNDQRANVAALVHQKEDLSGADAIKRRNLAREIMRAALEHCRKLNITVGVRSGRGTLPVIADSLRYHHPDAN